MPERLYFSIARKTDGDAGRVVDDPVGYFSCLYNTAKFLDIEKLAKPGLVTRTRKSAKTRTLNRATGTVKVGKANTDNKNADSEYPGYFSKGSRSVRLTTGKKIDGRAADVNAVYHTIGFRFPSAFTIVSISDALGSLIPAGKLKSTPSASEVSPYFKVVGGRKYPIMGAAAAAKSTAATINLTEAQITALLGGDAAYYPGII